MRVVIGYESMYGTTRRVAEAIGTGFAADDQVSVVPIAEASQKLDHVDVVVVGVPTHVHGLPKPTTRRAALEGASTRFEDEHVDPSANVAFGTREWLQRLPDGLDFAVATFDTRAGLPAWLTGHPARHVRRTLTKKGALGLGTPQSFLLDKGEHLGEGEIERARAWGAELRTLATQSTNVASRR